MAALRTNILANYMGQVWMAVMAVIFLPQYLRILGAEAFGLVGLMLSFQAILQLFDFGIGGATNRELARRAHAPTLADGSRDLVRSSELVIWLSAAAVALLMWAGSGLLAGHWLHLRGMTAQQAGAAIATMGLAIALLWPSTFYANCLSGLERQPQLNVIHAVFATLRYAAVLPVLWWVAPTMEAFLGWHAVVGALQSLVMAWLVWRYLPPSQRRARLTRHAWQDSRRFAGGLFAIGVLALGVSQLDRLVLTSLRPLEEMGYYTLALSVAAGLGRMVQPMFNALYPRFSRLIAQHDEAGVRDLYHLGSQYLAVVIAAIAAVLMVFGRDVLFLWAGDADLAARVAPTLTLLVAGSALNGLMNIPYALQLAHGWTRLAAGLNALSLLLGVPLCLWAVQRYGMVGAALPWLWGNLLSVAVGIPLMHRRLLPGQAMHWYLRDNMPPLLTACCVALAWHALLPPLTRSVTGLAWLGMASASTLLACALAAPLVRAALWRRWSGFS